MSFTIPTSTLDTLPDELALKIVSHSNVKDALALRATCRKLYTQVMTFPEFGLLRQVIPLAEKIISIPRKVTRIWYAMEMGLEPKLQHPIYLNKDNQLTTKSDPTNKNNNSSVGEYLQNTTNTYRFFETLLSGPHQNTTTIINTNSIKLKFDDDFTKSDAGKELINLVEKKINKEIAKANYADKHPIIAGITTAVTNTFSSKK